MSKKNGSEKVSEQLLKYIKRRKNFSTSDVSEEFDCSSKQAGARIAILRIKEVVEPNGTADDGSKFWHYTG